MTFLLIAAAIPFFLWGIFVWTGNIIEFVRWASLGEPPSTTPIIAALSFEIALFLLPVSFPWWIWLLPILLDLPALIRYKTSIWES